nr:PREDICTED: uncharacterized protein LOC109447349 isoform X1 [Rhinolophus sinicus]
MKDPAGGVCEEEAEEEGGRREEDRSPRGGGGGGQGYPKASSHLFGEGPHLCLFGLWRRVLTCNITPFGPRINFQKRSRSRSSENGGLCRKERCRCVSGTAHSSRIGALPGTSGHSPSSVRERGHSHSASTPCLTNEGFNPLNGKTLTPVAI